MASSQSLSRGFAKLLSSKKRLLEDALAEKGCTSLKSEKLVPTCHPSVVSSSDSNLHGFMIMSVRRKASSAVSASASFRVKVNNSSHADVPGQELYSQGTCKDKIREFDRDAFEEDALESEQTLHSIFVSMFSLLAAYVAEREPDFVGLVPMDISGLTLHQIFRIFSYAESRGFVALLKTFTLNLVRRGNRNCFVVMAEKFEENHKVFMRFFYLSFLHYKQLYRRTDAAYLKNCWRIANAGTGATEWDLSEKFRCLVKFATNVSPSVFCLVGADDKKAYSAHNSVATRLYAASLYEFLCLNGSYHSEILMTKLCKAPRSKCAGGVSVIEPGGTFEAEGDAISGMEFSSLLTASSFQRCCCHCSKSLGKRHQEILEDFLVSGRQRMNSHEKKDFIDTIPFISSAHFVRSDDAVGAMLLKFNRNWFSLGISIKDLVGKARSKICSHASAGDQEIEEKKTDIYLSTFLVGEECSESDKGSCTAREMGAAFSPLVDPESPSFIEQSTAVNGTLVAIWRQSGDIAVCKSFFALMRLVYVFWNFPGCNPALACLKQYLPLSKLGFGFFTDDMVFGAFNSSRDFGGIDKLHECALSLTEMFSCKEFGSAKAEKVDLLLRACLNIQTVKVPRPSRELDGYAGITRLAKSAGISESILKLANFEDHAVDKEFYQMLSDFLLKCGERPIIADMIVGGFLTVQIASARKEILGSALFRRRIREDSFDRREYFSKFSLAIMYFSDFADSFIGDK